MNNINSFQKNFMLCELIFKVTDMGGSLSYSSSQLHFIKEVFLPFISLK